MLTVKENFLATLNWETPDALVNSWEPFQMIFDPLMAKTMIAQKGKTVVDDWGVSVY